MKVYTQRSIIVKLMQLLQILCAFGRKQISSDISRSRFLYAVQVVEKGRLEFKSCY